MPPLAYILTRNAPFGKSFFKEVIIISSKMGRPTDNPRTEKIGFRLSKKEISDIQKCADAMKTNRVNAVVKGIDLLKKNLEIKD